MKCSLGISNFLEKISSLSRSIVFLYFFACSLKKALSLLSILWNSAFSWVYPLCLSLLFFQKFIRPPQTTILPFCISLGLEWKLTISSPVATAEFSKFAGILSAALSRHHLLGFDSSTGIPSPPLALFTVMLPKAHLTSDTRMSGSRWVITPLLLSVSLWSFLYSSSVYSGHLFLSSASVAPYHFCPLLCPALHEMFPW